MRRHALLGIGQLPRRAYVDALGRDVRRNLFTRVSSFSLNEVNTFGTATLITRTTNDVTQVMTVTTMILRMMVQAPLMMIGGLIMAFSQDRPLTLVLAVAIPAAGRHDPA